MKRLQNWPGQVNEEEKEKKGIDNFPCPRDGLSERTTSLAPYSILYALQIHTLEDQKVEVLMASCLIKTYRKGEPKGVPDEVTVPQGICNIKDSGINTWR